MSEEIETGVSHIAYFRTDSGSSKLYTQEYVDDLQNQLQQKDKEIERLNKENKILRKNAEHNDKVVDKVNWENKRLNNIINDKKERQDIAIRLLHKLFGTDDYEINYIIGIINGQRQIKFDEELKGDDSNEL